MKKRFSDFEWKMGALISGYFLLKDMESLDDVDQEEMEYLLEQLIGNPEDVKRLEEK